MPPFETIGQQLTWLLIAIAGIGILAQWLRVPYAVALVLAGLAVGESHLVDVPHLDPGLLLFVLLPPLLFDAAFRLDAVQFRSLLPSILLIAVPGTLFTALFVGAAVSVALQIPPVTGLLLGTIVAATDPVAVVSVFRRLRAPERLTVLAEGESLINDGMAITLYTVALGFAISGSFDFGSAISNFGREALLGSAIGVVIGLVGSRLTGLTHDHLVEMTLSTALAYGSYLAAQSLHSSGPLACVMAGLIHGSYGRRVGMSENARLLLDDLWEYLGFAANGVVFLLVGFTVSVGGLISYAWPVALAILSVEVGRVLLIGGLSRRLLPATLALSRRERVVLFWGGLRGALTLALALALPAATPQRELIVAMAFGVVLVTLVVQGLTLAPLIKALGVQAPTSS